MRDECPYCGESYSALRNHIRLASGNGHGSSGSYPDEENSDEPSTNPTRDRSVLTITEDELDARLTETSDLAYEAGREDERLEHEQSRNQEGTPETSSSGFDDTVTTIPVAQEDSESDRGDWLAAVGGLAALALLKKRKENRNSDYHRRRI